MISSEVERTLVKSPPELWTELSNPDALARHLGEFGEIRITRVEPEHAVEWEAQDTAGTVRIKPSGWGTKVTLTATREVAASVRAVAAEPAPEPPVAAIEPMAKQMPAPTPALEPEPNVSASPMVEAAPASAQPHLDAERSRGFLSRLFGSRRRRKAAGHSLQSTPAVSEPQRPHAETADVGLQSTQPAPEQAPDRTADLSADLKAAEEVAVEEVTSVLTSVLDRLGAAHHRPFSRA
jgi:hypothetical protein